MKIFIALLLASVLAQLSLFAAPAEKGSVVEKDRTLTWGFTPDPSLPNVLILGDSISIGYTLQVRELLKGKANVYRPTNPSGTRPENCSGSAKGVAKLNRWLSDTDWSVIHFNWGLHDLKHVHEAGKHSKSNDPKSPTLATVDVYSANLELIVDKLKATDARLVFATTTPVVEGTLNPLREPDAPVRYNAAALEVMKANDIRVNDLYAFTEPHLAEWQLPKNVHFNSPGSAALAKQVASVITEELNLAGVGLLEGDSDSSKSKAAKKKGPKYLETGGERKLNVVYKEVGKRQLQLDIYYPTSKRSEAAPVVVYTHGGGWAAGSRGGVTKGLFAPVVKQLLEEGFAVATVDYRLFNKSGQIAMRDCVIDSKDAVRYLTKNARSLGLDADRFYAFGDSAGGQIAQLLLLSPADSLSGDPGLADVNYDFVAGVSWYGPSDFRDMNLFNHDDSPNFKDRFGPRITPQPVTPQKKLERYAEMSPVTYLTKDSRPLFMIQGDNDTTIPVKHAYHMQKRAERLGAPVEILIVKNSGHNWRKAGGDVEPTREVIQQKTVDFFVHHLNETK
ncbi:MAG: prolyl oligopeptidase family serine peptidase [Opitutaceae bacterium]